MICCLIYHFLSVSHKWIDHSRFMLAIYPLFSTDSKQWYVEQQITAITSLFCNNGINFRHFRYYVIPSELWVSVHQSVSASFPCSNFSTFWPIFFKLCIYIGIGEEWYGIASGLISFWNNRVMALDVCQKCFALRFRALTLVPFYRLSSNFA